MWIGIAQFIRKTGPPQYQSKPVGLAWFDNKLNAFYFGDACGYKGTEELRFFCWNPARSPVSHNTIFDGTEISPGCNIAILQVHIEPQRFKNTTSYLAGHRIIAEKAQVSGTASRCYANIDRYNSTKHSAFLSKGINVRLMRRFKGGLIRESRVWDIAESVKYEKDDLVIICQDKVFNHTDLCPTLLHHRAPSLPMYHYGEIPLFSRLWYSSCSSSRKNPSILL